MVQKAVVYETRSQKIVRQDKDLRDLYALNRSRITVQQTVISPGGATPSAGGSQGGQGNFLETEGDTMVGPIAFNQVLVLINSDGRIKIGEQDRQTGGANSPLSYSTYVAITAASDPDDLYWIDGAAYNGQLLYAQGTPTQLINLKNAIHPQISNIVGLGTVTVTTSIPHGLTTGRIVNIIGTVNFNDNSESVTVTSTTVFTYSATGSASAESVGFVEDGNILSDDGTDVKLEGNAGNFTRPICELLFDQIDNAWRVVSRPDGTGVSFPIIPPVDVRGNVSTAQNIDLSLTTAHSTTMTLTGDIAITFSNFPATANQIEWEIEITQDATGGHDVTSWPAAVTPIPVINQTALATTLVVLRTNDNGTIIFTVLASSGVFSPVSLWANFVAVSTIDANNNDIVKVKNIDMDDANSTIQGIKELRFFDDDPNKNIQSAADELSFNVPALDQFSFYANAVEMIRIEEVTAGVYRLDLLDHSIDNAQDISFDDTSGATVFAGTDPAIGYDSVAARLLINMPTGGNLFITNNNVIGTTQINNNSLAANIVNANDVLQLGVDVTVPSVPGEFRNDGTDVTIFSGGAVRNLSDITAVGANQALSNLTSPTSINQNLIPQAGKLLGNTSDPWSTVTSNRFLLGTAGTFAASDNAIIADAATGMEFNTPAGDIYRWFFNAVGGPTMSVSELDMITGGFQGSVLQLTDTFPPIVTGELRRDGSEVMWEADEFSVRRTTSVAGENATINLVKVDPTPVNGEDIALINFSIFDTPTTTIYGQIAVENVDVTDNSVMAFRVRANNGLITGMTVQGDDNNQRIQILLGGTDQARIQPALGEMGYFVTTQATDFSLIIGTGGSLQVPQFSNGTPTLTQLNSAFGAFDGAIGQDISDGKLYVRKNSTTWSFYSESGTVV